MAKLTATPMRRGVKSKKLPKSKSISHGSSRLGKPKSTASAMEKKGKVLVSAPAVQAKKHKEDLEEAKRSVLIRR